ncbi:hypothetical protein QR680_016166 [Steinernema hermaphroditum]|uniref:Neurotransmitter-gated ion-channel ligand-binding domain-containing protein n=1 Tax=Steinernema hermaphroditum TaxID=289476 RepID=A0AA39LLV7_9BILA|nr:hypothetical protein QR680_016166 [Steinernema hermaphroditum]
MSPFVYAMAFGRILLLLSVFVVSQSSARNSTEISSEDLDDLLEAVEAMEKEETPPTRYFEMPVHYQLEKFLMNNYNRRLLPRRYLNESVKVKFSMELYQIIEVNEPEQYMKINAWIVERWYDDMLYWNPKQYGGMTEIILPREMIWLPDTTLYNSLVMNAEDTARLQNVKLTTDPSKRSTLIEFLYPTLYQFPCNLDLRYFPFDIQMCKMTFGSWTHDKLSIDYFVYNDTGKEAAIGMDQCIENEGWKILGTIAGRREEKYECCVNKYTLLNFALLIRRKPLFYLVNLVSPTCVISLISIVGFFSSSTINEYRDEKISLGITTLLSMSIMIFMVSDKMPSTSTFIPLIGWFYTSMMMLISAGTLCASIVIYIQKKGILGKRPSSRVMLWAQWLGKLCLLEMPLLMKEAYIEKAKQEKERLKQQSHLRRPRGMSIWQRMGKTSLAKKPSIATSPKKVVVEYANGHHTQTACMDTSKSFDEENGSCDNSLSEAAPIKASMDFTRNSTSPLIDMETSLYSIASEAKSAPGQKRTLAEIEYDWLAAVVERCFLISFLLFFVLFSVGINCIGLYYWHYATLDDFKGP